MARRPNRFEGLIDQWDPVLRDAFLRAVYQMRRRAHIDQIQAMLERNDIEGALRAVGLDPTSFRPLGQATGQAFEAGGIYTASGMPILTDARGFRTIFEFDVRNPSAENWLAQRSSTQVREILSDQRDMIRAHLRDAMERGINPRTAALDLVGRISASTGRREGGVIGLTSSQAEWVRNYRRELEEGRFGAALARELRDRRFDRTLTRLLKSGEPLPLGTIEAMVRNYKNAALKMRGDAIGRTEAMAALHQSQQEAIDQALDAGIARPENVYFIWRTAGDNRVRESHVEMDGQRVRQGEPFISGDGVPLMYPGDPNAPPEERINCRCWREPAVDFLAEID